MKQEIRLPKGYELKELEKGVYEIVKSEFKLEVGKDYIRRNNSNVIVIDRENDLGNNGFYSGLGFSSMNIACSKAKCWREATESEVIEAFEKELVRRHGENWKNVKVKDCLQHGNKSNVNDGDFLVGIVKTSQGWRVWNKNGCLYHKGKWAEALEEYPTIELRGLDSNIKYCSMHKNKAVYVWYTKPTVGQLRDCWHGQGVSTAHLDQSQFTELKKLNWKDSLHKIKHV